MEKTIDLQDVETVCGLLERRGATYALLARLYEKEVDEDLLEGMHGMLFPVSSGDDNVDEGYYLVARALSNLWADSLTDFSVDYGRSFIGQGLDSHSAAYPYESVYTSEGRLLMQEARDEVLAIYRSFGIGKADDWKECEDHISLELQFERILCDRTVEALRTGDESGALELLVAQRAFLEDHLCSWVPSMTEDLRSFAQTDLYKGLAALTDGFLETDLAVLDDLLG